MNTRILLLTLAALVLLSPTVAATDGTAPASSDGTDTPDDCGIICCFQENVVDKAQCTGDFFVVVAAENLPGRTGSTVLAVWGAGNTAVDNAQADAGDILCSLVVTCPVLDLPALEQSTQSSHPQYPGIVCSDDPLGWTVCFAAGIVLGPAYWCTGQVDVDYAQCVANGEVDHAQAYEQRMCDHVFQPRVCNLSPLAVDQTAAASTSEPAGPRIYCEDTPAGWTACFAAGIVLGPAYWCTGPFDVDYAQCLANSEVDHTQAYAKQMCEYVFQPRFCTLTAASEESGHIVCTNDPVGYTICYWANFSIVCTYLNLIDLIQCGVNGAVDGVQEYTKTMCGYVFQPWVCQPIAVKA